MYKSLLEQRDVSASYITKQNELIIGNVCNLVYHNFKWSKNPNEYYMFKFMYVVYRYSETVF